jgi:hypothetical protein
VPDSHLARRFNIGTQRIKYLRMSRGIAAATPPMTWTKAQDSQLGTRPDTELGKLWKRDASTAG